MSKFIQAIQERQFWDAVLGILVVFGVRLTNNDVDGDTLVNAIMLIVASLIGGTAIKDGLRLLFDRAKQVDQAEINEAVERSLRNR